MSPSILHTNRHFAKWPLVLLVFATLAIPIVTLCFHTPRAHAQQAKRDSTSRPPAPGTSPGLSEGSDTQPDIPSMPAISRTEQNLADIDNLIGEKDYFRQATSDNITDRLEVIAQCQQNMADLTDGVKNIGPEGLGQHIRDTRPLIRRLQQTMAQNRYKIALEAVTEDSLDRRVIELMMQKVKLLQPNPARLLALKRESDRRANAVLRNIDPDDPYSAKELEQVAMLRAKLQPEIEAEEGRILNQSADMGVAAAALEQREHDRYVRQQEIDLPTQLRNELLESPMWRGEE